MLSQAMWIISTKINFQRTFWQNSFSDLRKTTVEGDRGYRGRRGNFLFLLWLLVFYSHPPPLKSMIIFIIIIFTIKEGRSWRQGCLWGGLGRGTEDRECHFLLTEWPLYSDVELCLPEGGTLFLIFTNKIWALDALICTFVILCHFYVLLFPKIEYIINICLPPQKKDFKKERIHRGGG